MCQLDKQSKQLNMQPLWRLLNLKIQERGEVLSLLRFEGSPTLLALLYMKGNSKELNANLRENVTLPLTLITRCGAFNYLGC